MRTPFFLTLVVCSLVPSLALAELPPPAIPEIPVSAPIVTTAPLDQSPVVADSNGSVALVAWSDDRSGETLTYAARIGDTGATLDPLGIRIGHGVPKVVLWTGSRFLVLIELPILHELVFIDEDGEIVERRRLDVEEHYVATLEGAEIDRLLFLDQDETVGGNSHLRGIIVSIGAALPTIRRVTLPAAVAGLVDTHWIGSSDDTDFLVLRYQRRHSGSATDRIVADRIKADGTILSSSDTGLTGTLEPPDQLAGKPDGYMLVRHLRSEAPEVRSYRLTQAGVYTGETGTLGQPGPPPFSEIRLIRDGSRYLFAWRSPLPTVGISRTYATSVTTEGVFGSPNLIGDWRGGATGLTLAAQGTHRLVFDGLRLQFSSSSFDVMSTLVRDNFSVATRELVTFSSTLQSEVRVAASDTGYIVGWGENGPDRLARAFVRRFSSAGAPLDASPREIYAIEQDPNVLRLPVVRVSGNADRYVVAWITSEGLFARRIPADGSDWLDAEPIRIAPFAMHFDVTSSGTHALITWTSECSQGLLCVMSRRLALTGAPDLDGPQIVSGRGFNYDVAATSDGEDFLVVWVEGRRDCVPTCGLDPYSVLGARVSGTGVTLDPIPLPLEERRTFAEKPATVWDGQNYVVLWSSWTNGWSLRGVRITPEGSVLEKEALGEGTAVDAGIASKPVQPVLARFGDQLLMMGRRVETVNRNTQLVWTAVTFPAQLPLAQVMALPRQELFRHDSELFGSIHASGSARGLLFLGYDRVAEGVYAGVPRGFVTRFGNLQIGRRRAARR